MMCSGGFDDNNEQEQRNEVGVYIIIYVSEYNPQLSKVTPTTRVAYAKFMRSKIKSDFAERQKRRKGSDEISLEDEVFEEPTKRQSTSRKMTGRTFRSRTPIPETSDDEGLKDNEIKVLADIEDKGSEASSAQTRQLKSPTEPSEPSTPDFDPISDRKLPPPMEFHDHVIQIEPDTPTKIYESEAKLRDAVPRTESDQILSASALDEQYKEMTSPSHFDPKKSSVTIESESSSKKDSTKRLTSSIKSTKRDSFVSASLETQMAPSRLSVAETKSPDRRLSGSSSKPTSPRSSRVSPSSPTPSMGGGDRGKSKVTGKIVSGWL